jgi:hypothetical protein
MKNYSNILLIKLGSAAAATEVFETVVDMLKAGGRRS